MADNLYSHIDSHVSEYQHGFLLSADPQLLICEFLQYVSDARRQNGLIYSHLSKAFDVVNYKILLHRLGFIGVSLIKLFQSMLSDRYQYVEYNEYKSKSYITYSGVTQGSNLGPVLFIIYI